MRFFKKEEFEFSMQLTLGACSYQAADPGEALATAGRIRDGDANGWFEEWQQTADRVRALAEECAAAGRRVSARGAYLRAATYYANALYVIDATDETSRSFPSGWRTAAASTASPSCATRRSSGSRSPTKGRPSPDTSCGPGPPTSPGPRSS